jgi:hypothetical protein
MAAPLAHGINRYAKRPAELSHVQGCGHGSPLAGSAGNLRAKVNRMTLNKIALLVIWILQTAGSQSILKMG